MWHHTASVQCTSTFWLCLWFLHISRWTETACTFTFHQSGINFKLLVVCVLIYIILLEFIRYIAVIMTQYPNFQMLPFILSNVVQTHTSHGVCINIFIYYNFAWVYLAHHCHLTHYSFEPFLTLSPILQCSHHSFNTVLLLLSACWSFVSPLQSSLNLQGTYCHQTLVFPPSNVTLLQLLYFTYYCFSVCLSR